MAPSADQGTKVSLPATSLHSATRRAKPSSLARQSCGMLRAALCARLRSKFLRQAVCRAEQRRSLACIRSLHCLGRQKAQELGRAPEQQLRSGFHACPASVSSRLRVVSIIYMAGLRLLQPLSIDEGPLVRQLLIRHRHGDRLIVRQCHRLICLCGCHREDIGVERPVLFRCCWLRGDHEGIRGICSGSLCIVSSCWVVRCRLRRHRGSACDAARQSSAFSFCLYKCCGKQRDSQWNWCDGAIVAQPNNQSTCNVTCHKRNGLHTDGLHNIILPSRRRHLL